MEPLNIQGRGLMVADKKRALIKGAAEGALEVIKLVPGLSILIEGVRSYQENIEEQQREHFTQLLLERIEELANAVSNGWYSTAEGEEVIKKIVASALNAEYCDKIEYFANGLVNCSADFEQAEILKFIETLKHISKPALCILAKESELQQKRGKFFSPKVLVDELIKESEMQPHLVEACIKELGSFGIFSSTISYTKDGKQAEGFSSDTLAYTEFTNRFVNFIRSPKL